MPQGFQKQLPTEFWEFRVEVKWEVPDLDIDELLQTLIVRIPRRSPAPEFIKGKLKHLPYTRDQVMWLIEQFAINYLRSRQTGMDPPNHVYVLNPDDVLPHCHLSTEAFVESGQPAILLA